MQWLGNRLVVDMQFIHHMLSVVQMKLSACSCLLAVVLVKECGK